MLSVETHTGHIQVQVLTDNIGFIFVTSFHVIGGLLCVLPHFSTYKTVKWISIKNDIINLGQSRIEQTYL